MRRQFRLRPLPLLADHRVVLRRRPARALDFALNRRGEPAKAHTAVARTSGDSVVEAAPGGVGQVGRTGIARRGRLLPIAISTLRKKRSRPMRLTGDAGEHPAERRIVEPRRGRQAAARSVPARGRKSGSRGCARELVPRADRQAVVAAIDAVADQRPQRNRDHPLVLDRQIRDAAPRIELVGRRERRGRAGVEAAPAGAAMVGLRPRRARAPGSDRFRRETATSRNSRDTRLVCLPCQPMPGLLRQRLLHDRGGIDEQLQRARPAPRDPARERLQPPLQGVVIVAAARIDRDDAAIGPSEQRRGSSSGA